MIINLHDINLMSGQELGELQDRLELSTSRENEPAQNSPLIDGSTGPPRCAICHNEIRETAMRANGLPYHTDCCLEQRRRERLETQKVAV